MGQVAHDLYFSSPSPLFLPFSSFVSSFKYTLYPKDLVSDRSDEKQLWKQEWWEMLVDRELCDNSNESSSPGSEVKVGCHRFESIRK